MTRKTVIKPDTPLPTTMNDAAKADVGRHAQRSKKTNAPTKKTTRKKKTKKKTSTGTGRKAKTGARKGVRTPKKKKTTRRTAPVRDRPSSDGTMTLTRVALRKLSPAAYNPRVRLRPGDTEYEKLSRSIDAFGLVEPIVWNKRTGNIVGGHQRYFILEDRKVKETDVVEVDVSPAEEKALNIALNKISGRWDDDQLAVVLDELVSEEAIDETLTGFDAAEIEKILDDIYTEVEEVQPRAPSGQRRIEESYQVIVVCRDEAHQEQVHKLLTDAGHPCKVQTLY